MSKLSEKRVGPLPVLATLCAGVLLMSSREKIWSYVTQSFDSAQGAELRLPEVSAERYNGSIPQEASDFESAEVELHAYRMSAESRLSNLAIEFGLTKPEYEVTWKGGSGELELVDQLFYRLKKHAHKAGEINEDDGSIDLIIDPTNNPEGVWFIKIIGTENYFLAGPLMKGNEGYGLHRVEMSLEDDGPLTVLDLVDQYSATGDLLGCQIKNKKIDVIDLLQGISTDDLEAKREDEPEEIPGKDLEEKK